MLTVLDPGPLLTVQDLGRPGLAALGVPRSGAFDRGALRLANRLVGNPESAAALEFVLGCTVRFDDAVTIVLTGPRCRGLDWRTPVTVRAGTTVRLHSPAGGLRGYLAVRGGLDVPTTLGSAATDTLSGLGPAPLRAGDTVPVGPQPAGEVSPEPAPPGRYADYPELRLTPGPRADWFADDALDRLSSWAWRVRPDSDRIGLRLHGPQLTRRIAGELPSEPTIPGAVQVPPDGRPIVFGPDAPVTGGYPVIAVVREADLDKAAQLRPGDRVRFRTP